MRKNKLLVLILALTFVLGANSVFATDHPDHTQPNRDDGPAQYGHGNGRGNPNGNNGTIKVDGVEFDGTYNAHPNNEPHIASCGIQIDFYGFDSEENGDVAEVFFYHWDPSGGKEVLDVIGETADEAEGEGEVVGVFNDITNNGTSVTVPLDNDGAAGGIDIDRQIQFEIDIPDVDPGASGNHGHHIRVEVEVTSNGREYTKHKMFWASDEGCETAPDPNDSIEIDD